MLSNRLFSVLEKLVPLIQPIFRLTFLSRLLQKTTGGRIGLIAGHAERGNHEKAATLALETLNELRNKAKHSKNSRISHDWWFFMDLAASSLEKHKDHSKRKEVIELATSGAKSVQGYSASCSFLAIARWKYRDGDYEKTIEYAEIAASADKTWAEPDFFLGWLDIVLGGDDPMLHLTQAIRKDPRIIFRIASDPECRKHPHIVQRLKTLSSDSIVSQWNRSDVDNRGASTN